MTRSIPNLEGKTRDSGHIHLNMYKTMINMTEEPICTKERFK